MTATIAAAITISTKPIVLNGTLRTGDFDGGVGYGMAGDGYASGYSFSYGGASRSAFAGGSAFASAGASASASAHVSISTFIGGASMALATAAWVVMGAMAAVACTATAAAWADGGGGHR